MTRRPLGAGVIEAADESEVRELQANTGHQGRDRAPLRNAEILRAIVRR